MVSLGWVVKNTSVTELGRGGNTRPPYQFSRSEGDHYSIFHHGSIQLPYLSRAFYNMPLFGGYCDQCEQPVYIWVESVGGHNIQSATLVLHPEWADGRRTIEHIRDICRITGLHVFGLPARAWSPRTPTLTRVHRVQQRPTIRRSETIDLTEDSPRSQEGDTPTGTRLLYEDCDED